MKIGNIPGFVVSLLIVVVLGVALLFTNIWYLVVLAGLVTSLVIRKGYAVSLTSSFIGGILGILIIFALLPLSNMGALMNEVGALAGISSVLLIALIFLLNGGLCLSGALIGTFVARYVGKKQL